MSQQIRLVALGLVYRNEDILVEKYQDEELNRSYYRFLGGGVNLFEKSDSALAREFMEEINSNIIFISHKGTIENIFFSGKVKKHEIDIIYEIAIESRFYQVESFTKKEKKIISEVFWIPKEKFLSGELLLLPSGATNFI